MTRLRIVQFWALAAGALLGWRALAPVAVDAAVALVENPAAAVQTPAVTAAPTDRAVVRSRFVTMNVDAFPTPQANRTLAREPVLMLDLFPDLSIRAVFDRFDPNSNGVTWVGHVDGVPMSSVTLVYSGGLVAGSIASAGRVYSIRPAAADVRLANPQPGRELHVVAEIDQNALPREAPSIEVTLPAAPARASGDAALADTADFIDVMIVYTPIVATVLGGQVGTTNLANLAVSETNTSYQNSGVFQRLRLVHVEQVPYTETGDFAENLDNLRFGAPGLSGVAAMRDAYHADLVTMLIRPQLGDACGIAYIMTAVNAAFAPAGYNVVDQGCVAGYTYAHELGHNMGARHDWFVDSGQTPFPDGHGYVNPAPGQRWRTIMAYPDLCAAQGFGCTRVLYWSNPQLQYVPYCLDGRFDCSRLKFWFFPGSPMGVPAGTNTSCRTRSLTNTVCDADDARVLNTTALTVANFRASAPAAQSIK